MAVINELESDLPRPDDTHVPGGPKVRVYKPTTSAPQSLPLVLFIHGGGWFAGNLETEDRTCRMLCGLADSLVVSVEYRCGFDVPLETEVQDCVKAFSWAREQAAELRADPKKLVVLGGSAGGALAVSAVYQLIKAGKGDQIAGLVCMNGLSVLPEATPPGYKHLMKSYEENDGPLPFVSGKDTFGVYEHRKITADNINTDIFPTAGGPQAMRGFPATYIVTSDNDASRDDGTVLEAVLKDAGVRVKRDNFVGLAHYFWTFPLPKANERFWESLIGGIRWTLEASDSHVASP